MTLARFALLSTLLVITAVTLRGTAVENDIPLAPPESVGFSTAGLKIYGDTIKTLVDERRLAGVTTLVARHGKVVMFDAYGYQDLDAKKPMAKDTIFRIASMTKPITGVAMMMLWEQGKWSLDDPVAKHIPEFTDLKVAGANGPVPQSHPMTMRELMSHTAGFDVSAPYTKLGIPDTSQPLQAMIDALAKLPLPVQPGTDWRYGPASNIQGYLVEKLSGQTLDEFFRTRIFEPLKMADTGFWVEASKRDRVTRIYTYGDDKKVVTAPSESDPTRKPVFLSGSGGLLSTTADYYRFAQMLLNGGELDGARILQAEDRRADAHQRAGRRRDGRSLRPQGAGHRLRPRLRDRDGSASAQSHRAAATRSTGAAPSAPGSGSIPPTSSSSSA